MGYGIKHTTSNIQNTLRKGNIATTAAHSADPSQNFHSGIPLENGKHTVVQVHSSNDPDCWSLDDSDFVRLVRSMGSNAITIVEAKDYIKSQSDLFYVDNIAYNNSIKENLLVSLNGSYDSSFTDNQPTTNLITNTSTMYFSGNSDGQWTYQTVAGSGSISTENPRFSLYSAKLTRAGAGGEVNYYWNAGGALSLTPGETYTFSMLVWCDQPGMAKLFSYLAGTNGSSDFHPGDSQWHQLSMQFSPAASTSAAQIRFGLQSNNSNYPVTAYFDCAQVEAGSVATSFTENTRTQNTTWIDLGQSGSNATLEIDSFDNGVFKTNVGGGTSKTSIPKPSGLATDQYMTIEVLFKLNTLPTTQYGTNTPILGARVGSDYMIFAYPQVDNKSHLGVSYDDSRFLASHESVFETEAGRWVRFTHVGIPYVEGGYQRGKLMYYINGVLDRDEFISGDNNGWALPNPFYLAHDARWGVYSDLEFAEVKIYNKQLSAKEISQNFHGGNIVTDELVLAVDAGNLVSYESGSSTTYSTTGSLSGTLINGINYTNFNNGAWEFDGTDDFISIDTYTFGNGDWTVSMWVNADDMGSPNLLSNTSGGPVTNAFGFGSNKIHYRNYDGAWQTHNGNTTLSTGEWYHLTWVNYEGASAALGTMKMFVDGVADSLIFNSYTINGGPCNGIGSSWFNKFNGRIASVYFYDKSLTDDEVQQNYIAHKARFPS